MTLSILSTIGGFLKRVPWFVYVGVAVLALWFIDRNAQYREGHEDGRETVLAEFRAKEAEALKNAAEARQEADTAGEQRELQEAEIVGGMIDDIERAEANEENPLDALFR